MRDLALVQSPAESQRDDIPGNPHAHIVISVQEDLARGLTNEAATS